MDNRLRYLGAQNDLCCIDYARSFIELNDRTANSTVCGIPTLLFDAFTFRMHLC